MSGQSPVTVNDSNALVTAIGMNSAEYWRGGKYSVLNVKYLFSALGTALAQIK